MIDIRVQLSHLGLGFSSFVVITKSTTYWRWDFKDPELNAILNRIPGLWSGISSIKTPFLVVLLVWNLSVNVAGLVSIKLIDAI